MNGIEVVEVRQKADGAAEAAPAADGDMVDVGRAGARPATARPADFPPQAVILPDGSVRLTLLYPKTLRWGAGRADETFKELLLKRLNGKKMRVLRGCDKDNYAETLLSVLTDMPLATADILYDTLDTADIAAYLRVGVFFTQPLGPSGQR